ncbi:hypothetical protein Taro_022321 [Colocasia esculenta]|uniref:Uncharacterized protein n=1 Tax=Colocasia esculenta TaxID=4460 RepID=A0A843V7K3_COLES|nr:hypothetical protein [Colocasia esculenta]
MTNFRLLPMPFFDIIATFVCIRGPGPDPRAIDHGICHSGLAYHCGLLAKEISWWKGAIAGMCCQRVSPAFIHSSDHGVDLCIFWVGVVLENTGHQPPMSDGYTQFSFRRELYSRRQFG